MCKQAGIIRVKTLDELVDVGIAFLRQPLPRGRRVGVVTAGGGWGVLAADACDEMGLNVVSLPPETIEELDSFMPPWWNRGNPVDLVAGTSGEGFFRVLEVVLRCPVVDGVIMLGLMPILAPGQFRRPSEGDEKEQMRDAMVSGAAELFDRLNELSDRYDKPVVVASEPFGFGAALNRRITHAIADRNSVYYEMPHQAASVFAKLVQYGEYRRQWQ
jgi:acyl-CoA synthetase (NDP forming)